MSGKSLEKDVNESIRGFVQAIVNSDFKGNVSHAAEKFGVAQSYVYEFLGGSRGAGTKLLRGISSYSGVSIDQIMSGSVSAASSRVVEYDPQRPNLSDALKAFPISHGRQFSAATIGETIARLESHHFKTMPDQAVEAWTAILVSTARSVEAEGKGKVKPPQEEHDEEAPLAERLAAAANRAKKQRK